MSNFHSFSSADTRCYAKDLTRTLLRKKRPRTKAFPILLFGELGSGKTTFVKGFLSALGVRGKVVSPTFVVSRKYRLKTVLPFATAYHFDCYRLRHKKEATHIGLAEALRDPLSVVLIEWPDLVQKRISSGRALSVYFTHGSWQNERVITTRSVV